MTRPSKSIRTRLRVVILTISLVVITLTAVAFVVFEFDAAKGQLTIKRPNGDRVFTKEK